MYCAVIKCGDWEATGMSNKKNICIKSMAAKFLSAKH